MNKKKLLRIPYFQGALRPQAFREGEELMIRFEEEEAVLFRRLVEFVFEGQVSRGKISIMQPH